MEHAMKEHSSVTMALLYIAEYLMEQCAIYLVQLMLTFLTIGTQNLAYVITLTTSL